MRQGQPIPTYDQTTIQQVALALTGWTLPPGAAAIEQLGNFSGPMEPDDANHDMTAEDFSRLHAAGEPNDGRRT